MKSPVPIDPYPYESEDFTTSKTKNENARVSRMLKVTILKPLYGVSLCTMLKKMPPG
jgi:hypothetical protein